MRRQTTSTINEALSLWIDTMKLRQKVSESRLMAAWYPMVGNKIASLTRNIYIKNSTLYVIIDSSVVRNELMHVKTKLISQLNSVADGNIIDDIIFK